MTGDLHPAGHPAGGGPGPVPPAVRVGAEAWFASGRRVLYDPGARRMIGAAEDPPAGSVGVFERVVAARAVPATARWLTLLPGFPDGSYGFAQVDARLGPDVAPRLYVEYLGQGDSDAPSGYRYGTFERADLVEAQWRAHGVRRTMVVTFDYSSLVLMELLRRQQERAAAATESHTTIDAAFIVNGGLFADCHSHPWQTTPMLKSPLGRVASWAAQRSTRVFASTIRSAALFSRSYELGPEEITDLHNAITRRGGAIFLHAGAGFVDEHRAHADRWDLQDIAGQVGEAVALSVAGSREDPFEPRQITAAQTRLAGHAEIQMFPGGHLTTSEQPDRLADAISDLAARHGVGGRAGASEREM